MGPCYRVCGLPADQGARRTSSVSVVALLATGALGLPACGLLVYLPRYLHGRTKTPPFASALLPGMPLFLCLVVLPSAAALSPGLHLCACGPAGAALVLGSGP